MRGIISYAFLVLGVLGQSYIDEAQDIKSSLYLLKDFKKECDLDATCSGASRDTVQANFVKTIEDLEPRIYHYAESRDLNLAHLSLKLAEFKASEGQAISDIVKFIDASLPVEHRKTHDQLKAQHAAKREAHTERVMPSSLIHIQTQDYKSRGAGAGCGLINERCCDGHYCDSTLACIKIPDGPRRGSWCVSCGHSWNPCCDGMCQESMYCMNGQYCKPI